MKRLARKERRRKEKVENPEKYAAKKKAKRVRYKVNLVLRGLVKHNGKVRPIEAERREETKQMLLSSLLPFSSSYY